MRSAGKGCRRDFLFRIQALARNAEPHLYLSALTPSLSQLAHWVTRGASFSLFSRCFAVMSSSFAAVLCLALLVCVRCADADREAKLVQRLSKDSLCRNLSDTGTCLAFVLNGSKAGVSPVNVTETAAPFAFSAEPAKNFTEPENSTVPASNLTEFEVAAEPAKNFTEPEKTVPLPEQVQTENSTVPASKTQEDSAGEQAIEPGVVAMLFLGLCLAISVAIKTRSCECARMSSAPAPDTLVGRWKRRYEFNGSNCAEMTEALVGFVVCETPDIDNSFAQIMGAMRGVSQLNRALFVKHCAGTYFAVHDFLNCDFYQAMRVTYCVFNEKQYTAVFSHVKSEFLRGEYTLLRSQLSIPDQATFATRSLRYYNEDFKCWEASLPR